MRAVGFCGPWSMDSGGRWHTPTSMFPRAHGHVCVPEARVRTRQVDLRVAHHDTKGTGSAHNEHVIVQQHSRGVAPTKGDEAVCERPRPSSRVEAASSDHEMQALQPMRELTKVNPGKGAPLGDHDNNKCTAQACHPRRPTFRTPPSERCKSPRRTA